MKIKLIVCFDGTDYCGWQVQKNAVSVQEKIQDAVENVLGKRYSVTGCSRTDSGVHANMFCCSIQTDYDITIPPDKLPIAFNHYLPDDISVLSAETVDDSFHPRYDVEYKEYEYLIWNSPIRNPFLVGRAFEYPKKLDVDLMNEAAKSLVGKHDFKAFMSSGSDILDTVRNIKYLNVTQTGNLIKINVAADGFLYNMVRIIVGTLIYVSDGKININDLSAVIDLKERKNAGFTAPPQGLYLNKVVY